MLKLPFYFKIYNCVFVLFFLKTEHWSMQITFFNLKHRTAHSVTAGVFLPGGDWGLGVPPVPPGPSPKILPVPPNRPPSPLFDQSLSPQLSFAPKNFKKFLPHFSLKFDYFLAQNCIRKLYFMLKNTKICSNFAVGGHFWPQRTIFPSPPSSDSVPNVNPPSDSIPESKPPPKKIVKNPEQHVHTCTHASNC